MTSAGLWVIAPGSSIDIADLQGFATVANDKLSPPNPYAFPDFSTVAAPAKVTGTIVYGSGARFADGVRTVVRVSAYDGAWGTATMGGVATPDNSGRNYKIDWSWTAAAGATKYLVQACEFGLEADSILADRFLGVNKVFRIVAGTTFTDDLDFYGGANDAFADVDGWQTEALGSLVGAVNTQSPLSRLRELQRIRTDAWAQVLNYPTTFDGDASTLSLAYLPDGYKTSADQCVGTNPCPAVLNLGKLFLTPFPVNNGFAWDATLNYVTGNVVFSSGVFWTAILPSKNQLPALFSMYWTAATAPSKDFLLFKNIRFLFSASDENFTFGNPDINFDMQYIDFATTQAKLFWGVFAGERQIGAFSGAAPNITVTETFGYKAAVDSTYFALIKLPLRLGGFDIKVIKQFVAAGAHGTINFAATGDYVGPATARCEFYWPATSTRDAAQVLHPKNDGTQLALTALADNNVLRGFSFTNSTDVFPTDDKWPFVALNLVSLRGLWLADTLPIPAVNPYLDTDIAPYVQEIVNWEHRGDVGNSPDTSFLILGGTSGTVTNPRSSMRQPAPSLIMKTLEFGFATPALASNAKYLVKINFPDALTLAQYFGPGSSTGEDPLVVIDEDISIYVSLNPVIDITDPTTYGFKTTSGMVLFADVYGYYDRSTAAKTADGKGLYFTIVNDSGAAIPALTVVWEIYVLAPVQTVEPGLSAKAARWPVMRDTDTYRWYPGIDPYRQSNPHTVTLANGAQDNAAIEIIAQMRNFQYSASPVLPIYVSNTGTPNPLDASTYQLVKAGGTVTLANLIAQYGAAGALTNLHFAVYNNSGVSKMVTILEQAELYGNTNADRKYWRFQQYPLLIPSIGVELDPVNQAQGPGESFSNDIHTAFLFAIGPLPQHQQTIPQRGYVITDVLVRRWSKPTIAASARSPSKYLPPTLDADLQELTVSIGFNVGAVHTTFEAINPGTFTVLTTVTIPHGALEARVSLFLPVLHGMPLTYQATQTVRVEAVANFQPIFFNKQYSGALLDHEYVVDAVTVLVPELDFAAADTTYFFRYPNYFEGGGLINSYVQFPLDAKPVNDFAALLALL